MSRKHFIKIAAAIKAMQVDLVAKTKMAEELASTFADLNPAFKRGVFLEACGVR